jgi:CRP-like cAMP-binding protein
MKEILEALRQSDHFAELPENDLQELAASASLRRTCKRELIYAPGHPREQVYLGLYGRTKLARISRDGREVTLAILEAGELFGESALVLVGKRETLAETLTSVLLLTLRARVLQLTIERNPKILLRITRTIARRRLLVENRLEDVAFRSVPARLARTLLQLVKNYGVEQGSGYRLELRLTQAEIGNLIGSTRETTNHFLNEFRRGGLIQITQHCIDILEPAKLETLGTQGAGLGELKLRPRFARATS